MKRIIHIFLFAVVVIVTASGCKKSFDELSQNPNKPTSVPASLLFNGVLNNVSDIPDGSYEKWCQYFLENYDYYGNNRYEFGAGPDNYSVLNNVEKMEEEAVNGGADAQLNPYKALGRFFRAYFFVRMSLAMGDVPMSEALQGTGNLTPVYDAQKKVFQQSLLWLDSANTELASLIADNDLILKGDIFFDNNLRNWQKVVNTFHLRVLMHLSKKVDDADLNIKADFAKIVGDPVKYPVMESNDDNLQYVYVYPTNNYPNNPSSFGFNSLRKNSSATYVGLLTSLKDPRVYVTTEPATRLLANGANATSFTSFIGADPGEDLGTMYNKTNAGEYSLLNRKHFYDTYTGEPSIQIGYPELCFTIAEGINRGWVSSGALGNAEAYYTEGIKASRNSYGIPETGTMTAYFLHPGASLGTYDTYTVTTDYSTYYNQSTVKYAGNNADGLIQILQQKYLALFRHSGLESYYTYRRTGVPAFTTGPGTGNSQRIALRFQYFGSEKSANTDNYEAALKSQYGGNDDINAQMWLIK